MPGWTFFAPRPGTDDYHLLARYHLPGGELSPWRKLDLAAQPRGWAAFLWNPHKRERKALFDLTVELAQLAQHHAADLEAIQISLPYLAFLQAASHAPLAQMGDAVQFVLMKTSRSDEPPTVIFVSKLHDR